jgi:hypothetical protein
MEKERYTDAADSYRAFISQDRNNEKSPLLEMQAIEAYQKGGFPQLVLQGKKEFVENYSFGTAYWQGRDPKKEPQVVAVLQTNLKDVAQYYHAQAQRTKNVADYQEAAKWYRSYLTSFPDDLARPSPTTCWRTLCSRANNISMRRKNTKARPITNPTKTPRSGLCRDYCLWQAGGGPHRRSQGGRPQPQRRQFFEIRPDFPAHPESATVLTRATTDLYTVKDYWAIAASEAILRGSRRWITKQRWRDADR